MPKAKPSKRKPKFKVGQWVAIIGYDRGDPRAQVIIKDEIEPDQWVVDFQMDAKVTDWVYWSGELRPLTAREKG